MLGKESLHVVGVVCLQDTLFAFHGPEGYIAVSYSWFHTQFLMKVSISVGCDFAIVLPLLSFIRCGVSRIILDLFVESCDFSDFVEDVDEVFHDALAGEAEVD